MTVQIAPDEVTVQARAPARPWFAWASVGSAAIAAWLASWSLLPLPPPPQDAAFRAPACAAADTDRTCQAMLPRDLRATPSAERYREVLASDVVRAVELPTDGSLPARRPVFFLSPSEADLQHQAQTEVHEAVDRLDPWSNVLRIAAGRDPDPADVAHLRDWTAPLAPLPPLPTVAEVRAIGLEEPDVTIAALSARYNEFARETTERATADAAWRYGEARRAAIRDAWDRTEERERLAVEAQQRRFDGAVRNVRTLRQLAGAAVLVSLLLVAGWVHRRPRTVRVSPHQLQFGARTVPWTEVTACHWAERPPRIVTQRGALTLAGCALSPDAIEALRAASAQALERTRRLDPLDRRALTAVTRLRQ